MPVIACSSCKSRFKVPIETISQTVECPRCQHEFKAVAMHTKGAAHGTPPVVYGAVAVGVLLFTLLVASIRSRREEPVRPADDEITAKERPRAAPVVENSGGSNTVQGALEERARKIFEAIRLGDDVALPGWIDYARMHEERRKDGLDDRPWTSLSEPDKYAIREACLTALSGTTEDALFMKTAAIESLEVKSMARDAVVVLATKNPLRETTRLFTMTFSIESGAWKLVRLDRGEIEGGAPKHVLPEGPAVLNNRVTAGSPEGTVEQVPLIDGTAPSVTSKITAAIGILTDSSATVAANGARADLVAAGKPAIPHLLNALIPLDFDRPEDALVGVRLANTLIELTGEDLPISPGVNTGSMIGEFATDNESNRKRWFGWWKKNQDRYSGPPAPNFDAPIEDDR